jgi:hypothetical protein
MAVMMSQEVEAAVTNSSFVTGTRLGRTDSDVTKARNCDPNDVHYDDGPNDVDVAERKVCK